MQAQQSMNKQTKSMHQNKQSLGSFFGSSLMNSAPAQQSTLKAEKTILDTLKNDKRFSKLVALLNDNKGIYH